MVHKPEAKPLFHYLRYSRNSYNRVTGHRIRPVKEVLKDIGAWLFTLFVFALVWLGLSGLFSCSGNQKPTINMQNCIVIESPADGNMSIKCDLDSDDKQAIEELKNDKENPR